MFSNLLLALTLGLTPLVFQMTHPVLMAGSVILLSALIGLWLGFNLHVWIVISLMLIFLGGMMVIFIYLTTLASMDKLILPSSLFSSLLLGLALLSTWCLFSTSYPSMSVLPLASFYSSVSNSTLFFATLYLLLGLLVIVKLSEVFKGSVSSW